ncbi:MAG: hypothetical protein M3537_09650, partial [Chloroflexota bacterium]|nr:hypothetical protein [Chloroflexota bacterium]
HYIVRLTDGRNVHDEPVPSKHTVDIHDLRRAADLVAAGDVVGVEVRTSTFDDVAAVIAAGLSQTRPPVTVIALENDEQAGQLLSSAVERLAGHGVVERHGSSGAVIDRAIAHRITPMRRCCWSASRWTHSPSMVGIARPRFRDRGDDGE